MVDDVEPYELMKLRLLNGGHQALAYAGYLAGHRLVHDAARDPLLGSFLGDYMRLEATPTLPPVPGIDLAQYADSLIARFSNPGVADTLARLCANSSELIPKFILPVVRDQLARGGPIERAMAVVACWARYAEGIDEAGHQITVDDPRRDQVVAAARADRSHPGTFLDQPAVFADLGRHPVVAEEYRRLITDIRRLGLRATLAALAPRPPAAAVPPRAEVGPKKS
jgi:mannitol 2-dehydrogenase